MWIKVLLVLLFLALLASLGSGLFFLMKDQGTTRRTLHSLGVRVTLAAALLLLLGYGIYSGEIRSKAPWDARLRELSQGQQQETND
jgi:Protein of unknown function (DUF2909)